MGRIAGPFLSPPFNTLKTSPIGLHPKKKLGEFRLIHHLSYPKGDSVNDGFPSELCSVKYATIDTAINLIKQLGRGCYHSKTDIESAFRLLPVHPSDYPLLGFTWGGGNTIMINVFLWVVVQLVRSLSVLVQV